MSDLPDRFEQLRAKLTAEHVERDEEIQCALLALVAGCTCFFLGEPGIAKSMLPRRIRAYVSGGNYFDHDMDKFSVPEDLFGPRSLSAMRDDRWERTVDGTLVTADWCFLDEFFEASSALLKTLLRALNEREFHQGTEIIPMNLTTVFCASNEIPSEPRLMPLYDRLLLRRHLRPIQESGGFARMLGLERDAQPAPVLCWDDVRVAQSQAAQVTIPAVLRETMTEIRIGLAEQNIHASDRRFFDSQRVVRAAAWMEGCAEAEAEHLRCLADVLWGHPDQISEVTRVVDTVLEPLVSKADELLREIRGLDRQIQTDLDDDDRQRLATELHLKASWAEEELDRLRAESSNSPRQRRKLAELKAAHTKVCQRILVELFRITPGELEARRGGAA
jgi:MoxR-like ATPase